MYRESIHKRIESIKKDKEKEFAIDTSEYYELEMYQVPLKLFKNLVLLSDGKKKEWIYPTVYSKCLAFELIYVIVKRTGWVLKYLSDFTYIIKEELFKILLKNFETTNDFIMGNSLV